LAGLRTAWLNGLLSLHIPGGGFRQNPVAIDDSDYDNGEGWLALAVYCEMHKDDVRTASALSKLDDTLMRRYSENPSINFFGWGAMAAAQRYRTTHDPKFLAYLRWQGEVGDDAIMRKYRGRVVADAFTHGTSEQRKEWFKRGFETGDFSKGDTFAGTLNQ
jgi:hypothetical protein